MATHPVRIGSATPTETTPLAQPGVGSVTMRKAPPLWRFALVGLGPLGALGLFALVLAGFQHLA